MKAIMNCLSAAIVVCFILFNAMAGGGRCREGRPFWAARPLTAAGNRRQARAMIGRILLALLLWCGGPVAAADPFDPLAIMIEGQEALARGDLDRALAVYGRGLADPAASDRYKVSYHMGRSRVRALQGRPDLALIDADAAAGLADRAEPAMARGNVHAVRGLLLAGVGRRPEAIAALEQALALLQSPDDDYAGLLTEMMRQRPDQMQAMRRQVEATIQAVKEKLAELRGDSR